MQIGGHTPAQIENDQKRSSNLLRKVINSLRPSTSSPHSNYCYNLCYIFLWHYPARSLNH